MRHAQRSDRLSRTAEHRDALLSNLARAVVERGQIRTTLAKAKASQRVIDRLVSLGKDGSVHARRQAYRVLKDRELVKRLFADIAPRFLDCPGGYTRVLRDASRRGDGAAQAILALSRLPAPPAPRPAAKTKPAAAPGPSPEAPRAPHPRETPEPAKPKRFFDGLRKLLRPKDPREGAGNS